MINKSLEIDSPYFDKMFENPSQNAWDAFIDDTNLDKDNILDKEKWKERFRSTPIGDNIKWTGLSFENEADYVLFMMEWS